MSYSPKWLRFLAWHAEEWLDSQVVPSYLYDEFEHLSPSRICSCGSRTQADDEPPGHGGVFESKLPTSVVKLDFLRAYSALPMWWRGRTEAWLLLQGISEQAQHDAGDYGFAAWHRSRLKEEIGQQKSPAAAIGLLRGDSVWDVMSRYLSGRDLPASSA